MRSVCLCVSLAFSLSRLQVSLFILRSPSAIFGTFRLAVLPLGLQQVSLLVLRHLLSNFSTLRFTSHEISFTVSSPISSGSFSFSFVLGFESVSRYQSLISSYYLRAILAKGLSLFNSNCKSAVLDFSFASLPFLFLIISTILSASKVQVLSFLSPH